jgi:chitodextrinase
MLVLAVCAGVVPAVALGGESAADGPLVTLRGTLEVGHYDNFKTGRAEHFSFLRTPLGQVPLRFRKAAPEQLTGRRVVLGGIRTGGGFAVRSLRLLDENAPRVATLLSNSGVTTSRVAVILVNFANDSSRPWTPETVRGVLFDDANSAAAYFDEVTVGKLSLVGDIHGWFTLPYSSSQCAPGVWADSAKAALAASGVDPLGYDKFVYAFPQTPSCEWTGLGGGADAWVNGAMMLQVVAHELGHTFGLGHSKSMSCTSAGTPVSIASDLASCTVNEYGDLFDIMGSGTGRHANNVAKASRSWIDSSAVQTVTASGSYSLAPPQGPAGTLPQLLRVQRADGSWLNLEFRRPFGQYFDTFGPSDPVVNGVSIRWTSATGSSPRLLDATPETTGFWDAPLAAGKVFEDTAGGVSIQTLSVSETSATLEVAFGAVTPLPDTEPPTTPSPLAVTAVTDARVDLAWGASSDNVGVAAYRVWRDGGLVATLSEATLSYSDGGVASARSYRYSVAAVDTAGNVGPALEADVATPAPPDAIPPTAPTGLTATPAKGRKILLRWYAATDNVGVAGYRVLRDGVAVATVAGTSYTDSPTAKGRVVYTVVAFDAAGNTSPASNPASG